MNAIIAKYI